MGQPTPVLDLNLATRPFRNNTLLWLGFGLGVAAVLALTVWNVRTYGSIESDLDSLRRDMAAYEGRMQDLRERNRRAENGIENHDIELLRVQATKANGVIELKAFSWTMLFNRLEDVLPYNVRMRRVRPMFRIGRDAREQRQSFEAEDRAIPVMIDGEAQDLDAFFDFQASLLASPYFERVEPERQSRADRGIEFALQFMYFPNREPEAAVGDGAEPGREAAGGEADPPGEPPPSGAEGPEGAEEAIAAEVDPDGDGRSG